MSDKNVGDLISTLRKEKGMTQSDLASKMHVTDKAVSKWERNLSYPDVNSISKLAEILGISTDELLNAKNKNKEKAVDIDEIIDISLLGIAIAMGICVVVTSILKEIDISNSISMLGIGLTSIGIYLLKKSHKK